jgi:integrase
MARRAHNDGGIEQRGEASWRLRYRANGRRYSTTFHGTKKDALAELRRLIKSGEDGEHVDPSKITLTTFLDCWERDWATGNVSPKTRETYAHHLKHVRRHLGDTALQRLQPVNFAELYARLLRNGEAVGLAPRTVGHIHRIVHRALGHAVQWGLLLMNPTDAVSPPRVPSTEIEVLQPEQVQVILNKLRGRSIYLIAALAIATGMRRGELLALRWKDLDTDGARLRVERSVEQTKAGGLVFKSPKTKHGRRTISLPASIVTELRAHRRQQLEQRIALGRGKSAPDDLVFPTWDGATRSPNALTKEWSVLMEGLGLTATFHSLRHTHASHLIASGLDVITISRRLGHGSPSITLGVYGTCSRTPTIGQPRSWRRAF